MLDRKAIIVSILEKYTGIDKSCLFESANLRTDLGIDSLALYEIITKLEKTFHIVILDDMIEKTENLADLISLVEELELQKT